MFQMDEFLKAKNSQPDVTLEHIAVFPLSGNKGARHNLNLILQQTDICVDRTFIFLLCGAEISEMRTNIENIGVQNEVLGPLVVL